jgi:hypothetical protein
MTKTSAQQLFAAMRAEELALIFIILFWCYALVKLKLSGTQQHMTLV